MAGGKNIRVVELFAGVGGFRVGLEAASPRFETVWANQWEPGQSGQWAYKCYAANFGRDGGQANCSNQDIASAVGQVPPHDLLVGGFPCQDYSVASTGARGIEGKKGVLWWSIDQIVRLRRPKFILLENVDRLLKSPAGQRGRDFGIILRCLWDKGYVVEWRELVAADYGAPTTRKRFFLIARSDGRPIVWPEPTHAPTDSQEVKAGTKKPWRSAAEIIDWSLPTPSVFATKEDIREQYDMAAVRPLARNTMRRVARGVDKFVIRSASPFLVVVNHTGEFRGQGLGEPLQTITAKNGYGAASPAMAPLTMHNNQNAVGTSITDPVNTITGTGAGGHQMMIAPAMIQYHTEQTERVRGQGVTDPIMTIDASNRYGLAAATLTKYYNGDHNQDAAAPLHTITTRDREGLTMASLSKFYGGVVGAAVSDPLPTVTAVDHNALQTAHMIKMKGTNLGGRAQDPLQTVTAGGSHHGVVSTKIAKAEPGTNLQHWPEIRAMLNAFCDYHLEDDAVILFSIAGAQYFMADIGLRMLTPRELYRANGFPEEYIIDRDYTGKAYGKTKQVARCGNTVPPPFAEALVQANLPEWCGEEITTMEKLEKVVAV